MNTRHAGGSKLGIMNGAACQDGDLGLGECFDDGNENSSCTEYQLFPTTFYHCWYAPPM